jgi:hypothetical protein
LSRGKPARAAPLRLTLRQLQIFAAIARAGSTIRQHNIDRAEHDCALDDILQFTDIAGPGITRQVRTSFR